jgi:predicted nucleic acid-binding protein
MDCLVDTNVLLRAADRRHADSLTARNAMKSLYRKGHRLCIAKQSLLEAWVVTTRPREVNGLGYTPEIAASGLFKLKRLFRVLSESDEIHAEWERLVLTHGVSGKAAYDARLVAAARVNRIASILTFNTGDFKRYTEVEVTIMHPEDVLRPL